MGAKVLMIGLDGADPGFVQEHLAQFPNLQRLIYSGAWGQLRSTIPPITSAAWATAMSGMNPGKTGVSGFVQMDFAEDGKLSLLDSRSVSVPRIWNVLTEVGKSVAVVSVPMTYPPEQVNGVMISGFMTPSRDNCFAFPLDIQDEALERGYELFVDYGKYKNRDKQYFLEELYCTSQVKFDFVLDLLNRRDWDCFIFVVSETDWIQHYLMRPQGDPEHEKNERDIVRYFEFVDDFIGKLLDNTDRDSYKVVLSDHGFGRFIHRNVHLNRWLLDRGDLVPVQNPGISLRHKIGAHLRSLLSLPGMSSLKNILPSIVRQTGHRLATQTKGGDIDWSCTRAHYYTVFGSVGCVRINRTVVEDYEAYRRDLAMHIRELKDPKRGCLLFDEVYLREELYQGPFVEKEPDIISLFADGFGGSDVIAPQLAMPLPSQGRPAPGHKLMGLYCLAGPDIRGGINLDANIQDICPTVYRILGVPLPYGMDGKILMKAFESEATYMRGTFDRIDYTNARDFIGDIDQESSNLVKNRLRALGYID